jgi:Uncharacterized protein conserved in bacteria
MIRAGFVGHLREAGHFKAMKHPRPKQIGIGLGLRRENIDALLAERPTNVDCLEIAPENFMGTGGKNYRKFRELAELYPMLVHGLTLSVGSLKPLDRGFLKKLKLFLKEIRAPWMTDHLCYASVQGKQFHDLLPLPLTQEALRHVVKRIRQVQDFLELPFAVENVSYYAPAGAGEMPEWEFLSEVVERAGSSLLFDVNNVYVNSVNHRFDPMEYLRHVPLNRVIHVHIAGHTPMKDFLLDTHGAEIIHPVWKLFEYVAKQIEIPGVIIERDHNVPALAEQVKEVEIARRIVRQGQALAAARRKVSTKKHDAKEKRVMAQ